MKTRELVEIRNPENAKTGFGPYPIDVIEVEKDLLWYAQMHCKLLKMGKASGRFLEIAYLEHMKLETASY
jgi:hypothetical protein